MKIIERMKNINSTKDCCHDENVCLSKEYNKIILVGSPNVGKSALFNALTDSYVTVSNYPGTTVGIAKTTTSIEGKNYEVIDTPGMYSLLSITEEEKISRKIVFSYAKDIIIHVVDAKNIERMLPLTLQLIEANFSVILVLNLMDELDKYKIKINIEKLGKKLKIPVIPTIATKEVGVNELKTAINTYRKLPQKQILLTYSARIEKKIEEVIKLPLKYHQQSLRSIALLLLQDETTEIEFIPVTKTFTSKINIIKTDVENGKSYPFLYEIALARQQRATEITSHTLSQQNSKKTSIVDELNELMINPWTGIPILIVVIYIGLYQIVGKFGAGYAVDFIENIIFKNYINPFFIHTITSLIPWKIVQNLFVGEYGMLTLGVRYAVAIILPIVGTFFCFCHY